MTVPPEKPVKHSTYAALVESDADMIGHVAYSLYKREKLKFCSDMSDRHQRPVSADDVEIFIRASNLPTRVQSFRTQAEAALADFAQEVLAEQIDVERTRLEAEYVLELRKGRSFWRSVGENLVANLLAIAVGALVVAILYGSRIGFVPLLGDIFGYEVKERAASPPAQLVAPR